MRCIAERIDYPRLWTSRIGVGFAKDWKFRSRKVDRFFLAEKFTNLFVRWCRREWVGRPNLLCEHRRSKLFRTYWIRLKIVEQSEKLLSKKEIFLFKRQVEEISLISMTMSSICPLKTSKSSLRPERWFSSASLRNSLRTKSKLFLDENFQSFRNNFVRLKSMKTRISSRTARSS